MKHNKKLSIVNCKPLTVNRKLLTYLLLAFCCLLSVAAEAQQSKFDETHTWSIGVQGGLQAGGAIPIPLTALSGKESAVNVSLGVYPLLAVKSGYRFAPRWQVFAEFSYAANGFDADARVTNQRIKEADNQGNVTEKYFTGISHIQQRFDFFEVPVYAKFSISPRNKLTMGIYGAYQSNGKFITTAVKGFVGVTPNTVEAPVTEPIVSNFSGDLHKWDIGLLLGYEFVILPRFNAGVRFDFSPFDIFKSDKKYFDYTMHQLRGSITLSYEFWRN